ncbi:ATP-binding protein [Streptomyces sp. GLT-R25]
MSGTAGVGKTALAVHWARRAQNAFPDGQLYVNLRGFDPGGSVVSPAQAVRGFLDAFGVPVSRVPADLEAQTGLYRSLLAGRRVLVVLDNARDAEQVRPLLPGAPGCLALVTSRSRLTGLAAAEGAQLLTVGLLDPDEARDLLAGRLGADKLVAEPDAVREIVARCAGLPLALAIVAARAAAQPGLPLAALAAELRGADGRLDALDGGEATSQVRAVFSWSYQALSTDAGRLFRLLGLHPGPDASLPVIAALAGLPSPRARVLLAELVRGHLLTEHAPGRYTFHDLLRAYAAELVATHDSDDVRHTAARRMLDHYLHTAHSADALLTPRPNPAPLPPARPGAAPEALSDHRQAQAWFTAEHPVLLAAVEQAAAAGFDVHTWRLASALTTFLDRHGYWRALTTVHTAALEAALRRGDKAGQADAHRGLGLAQDRLDRPDDARAHYLLALDLFGELANHGGQARIHQHLSRMSEALGHHEQALGHARHSLTHHRAADDRAGQSAALNHIGWILAQLGDHDKAFVHCHQALDLAQETGDLNGQAHIWDSLGYIHHHLGRYPQAVDCYRQAVDLFHQTGDRHSEAAGLLCLGDTHHSAADPDGARAAWTEALTVTGELGLPDTDPLRTDLLQRLGRAAADAGRLRSGPAPCPAPVTVGIGLRQHPERGEPWSGPLNGTGRDRRLGADHAVRQQHGTVGISMWSQPWPRCAWRPRPSWLWTGRGHRDHRRDRAPSAGGVGVKVHRHSGLGRGPRLEVVDGRKELPDGFGSLAVPALRSASGAPERSGAAEAVPVQPVRQPCRPETVHHPADPAGGLRVRVLRTPLRSRASIRQPACGQQGHGNCDRSGSGRVPVPDPVRPVLSGRPVAGARADRVVVVRQ